MREAGCFKLWVYLASLYLGVLAPHVFALGPEWDVAWMQGKLLSGLWTDADAGVS